MKFGQKFMVLYTNGNVREVYINYASIVHDSSRSGPSSYIAAAIWANRGEALRSSPNTRRLLSPLSRRYIQSIRERSSSSHSTASGWMYGRYFSNPRGVRMPVVALPCPSFGCAYSKRFTATGNGNYFHYAHLHFQFTMNMKVKKFENSNVNFHECTIRIRVSNRVPCQKCQCQWDLAH